MRGLRHRTGRGRFEDVATIFLAAQGDDDTSAVCALLATKTREELEYSEGESCATSLKSVDLDGGSVGGIAVWGDRAQA